VKSFLVELPAGEATDLADVGERARGVAERLTHTRIVEGGDRT
jgi:hypothetical protein